MDTSYEDFKSFLLRYGFEKAYSQDITKNQSSVSFKGRHEVWAHRDFGIIVNLDTYYHEVLKIERCNSADMYYNWKSTEVDIRNSVTSSGHYVDPVEIETGVRDKGTDEEIRYRLVWAGNHDIRSDAQRKLRRLIKHGDFLPVWIDDPHVWLINHGDTGEKNVNFTNLIKGRIDKMPVWVKDIIGDTFRK